MPLAALADDRRAFLAAGPDGCRRVPDDAEPVSNRTPAAALRGFRAAHADALRRGSLAGAAIIRRSATSAPLTDYACSTWAEAMRRYPEITSMEEAA